ncbi:DUF1707 SHOCT-like domain-containing protein [Kribbella sindirgiensis]|uniref:DUF1707 domain-containing protein n=1 Tax=Kribbella sindirgiensis TaxID=1124744 RepID=A0A4R0IM08_9ACTN|nr:DUF1707 domain-containing protein [Kribbella sindirgiensis]TCC34611.1 DUF1707 domain-containing protein [Kribbella sindirgiensis]
MNDERPGGSIRIGDSEREDAVRRLGEHYEAGRLSADEHSERVEQALQAKTGADLDGLFADLPGAHQATEGAAAAGAGANGPGAGTGAGPGGAWSGPRRPAWAARGFLGRVPFPLLILLGVVGVLASIGCVVGGGHPPVLPLLLIVAGVLIVRKRRMERRA